MIKLLKWAKLFLKENLIKDCTIIKFSITTPIPTENILKKSTTSIFIAIIITVIFQLSACSNANLQSNRLDSAESYIERAEQIIANSPGETEKNLAEENLGTAIAYLETVRDNRKFLTKDEYKRRLELKQRADKLINMIRR